MGSNSPSNPSNVSVKFEASPTKLFEELVNACIEVGGEGKGGDKR